MAAQQDSKPAQPQAQQTFSQQDEPTGGGLKRKECPLCDLDSHKLQVCRKFKALPMADWVEIVMKNGLCFRCLTYGHLAKECGRRHHEQMHDPSRERQPQNQDQAQDLKTIVNPVAIVNKTIKKGHSRMRQKVRGGSRASNRWTSMALHCTRHRLRSSQ